MPCSIPATTGLIYSFITFSCSAVLAGLKISSGSAAGKADADFFGRFFTKGIENIRTWDTDRSAADKVKFTGRA
jgi:hypothetical protein